MVPVYGAPKIPAPLASVSEVVAVVTLIADSAATATAMPVVPVAANWPNACVAQTPSANTAGNEFRKYVLVNCFLLFGSPFQTAIVLKVRITNAASREKDSI